MVSGLPFLMNIVLLFLLLIVCICVVFSLLSCVFCALLKDRSVSCEDGDVFVIPEPELELDRSGRRSSSRSRS